MLRPVASASRHGYAQKAYLPEYLFTVELSETQPWKHRLNFQTISPQQPRCNAAAIADQASDSVDSLRGKKRGRTGGLVSWQTAWWAGTSLERGVVNGKPLFSNQIICSTLGGETTRGKRWFRIAREQVFSRSTLSLRLIASILNFAILFVLKQMFSRERHRHLLLVPLIIADSVQIIKVV